jgi:hypothetical protein
VGKIGDRKEALGTAFADRRSHTPELALVSRLPPPEFSPPLSQNPVESFLAVVSSTAAAGGGVRESAPWELDGSATEVSGSTTVPSPLPPDDDADEDGITSGSIWDACSSAFR